MSAEQDAGKSGRNWLPCLDWAASSYLAAVISRFPNYQGVTAICSQP